MLAGTDADLGETCHEFGLRWVSGAELEDEVQDIEEFGRGLLRLGRERLDKIDRWCGLGCSLSEKLRQWLHLVAGLDLLHVVYVARIEQLRPIGGERQVSIRAKYFLDALRSLAFPIRSRDEETTAIVAGRAASDVVEIERVRVNQLDAEIAFLFDLRHGEHQWFGAKVHAKCGVRGI